MKIATVVLLLCTCQFCYANDDPSAHDYIIIPPAQPVIPQNDMLPYAVETYESSNTKQATVIGYTDKGDSIEFVFGQQATIRIGSLEIALEKRRDEIKQVNLPALLTAGTLPINSLL